MKQLRKSVYRIVPKHEDDNIIWAVKMHDTIIKSFSSKHLAENFKIILESNDFEKLKYDQQTTFTINI